MEDKAKENEYMMLIPNGACLVLKLMDQNKVGRKKINRQTNKIKRKWF